MDSSTAAISLQQSLRAAKRRKQLAYWAEQLGGIVIEPQAASKNAAQSESDLTPQKILKSVMGRGKRTADFIRIPIQENSRAVENFAVSTRLYKVLVLNNIRTVGELNGRSYKEIARFRGCGPKCCRELRALVEALQRQAGMTAEPPRPPPKFSIAASVRDVEISGLAIPSRLKRVLKRHGTVRLGDLDGVPIADIWEIQSCGPMVMLALLEVVSLTRRDGAPGGGGRTIEEFKAECERRWPRKIVVHRRWPEHEMRLLGCYPDAEVARRLGYSVTTVRRKRLAFKIPLYRSASQVG
jgi:hypothetical protein